MYLISLFFAFLLLELSSPPSQTIKVIVIASSGKARHRDTYQICITDFLFYKVSHFAPCAKLLVLTTIPMILAHDIFLVSRTFL